MPSIADDVLRAPRGEVTEVRYRADLPERLSLEGDAKFSSGTGETFDFLWTPTEPGEATLSVRYEGRFVPVDVVLRQTLPIR